MPSGLVFWYSRLENHATLLLRQGWLEPGVGGVPGSKEGASRPHLGPELGLRGEGVGVHTPACARLSPPPQSCILGLKWVKRHTGNLSPGGCELSRGEAGQPAATGQSAGALSLLSRAPSRPGVFKGKPLLHLFV